MAQKSEPSQITQEIATGLLIRMGIDAQVTAERVEEAIQVRIDGDDLGILIGYHGENLKALQIILGILVNRRLKEDTWARVLVDVGNWRSLRSASLEELAKRAVERVRDTGEPYDLPPMTPDERRLIHVYLQDEAGIASHSEGEGSWRHIVVSKVS